MLEIYALTLEGSKESWISEHLLSLVPPDVAARIRRLRFAADRGRACWGEVLTRFALCLHVGGGFDELAFATNEYGKPRLVGFDDVHFNRSHSGCHVVCALSDCAVGADVEAIAVADIAIAERFFAPAEAAAVCACAPGEPDEFGEFGEFGEQTARFYDIWTRKESYIKMLGKGMSIPLDSFCVLEGHAPQGVCFHSIVLPGPPASCHVCSPHAEPPTLTLLTPAALLARITPSLCHP
jgi:4'-phosphopantetheinyl transferase